MQQDVTTAKAVCCGNCAAFVLRDGSSCQGACYRFDTIIRRDFDQDPFGARCFEPAVIAFELEPAPVGAEPTKADGQV